MAKVNQEYNVSALRKSIAVMEVVKNSPQCLGVSEIARQAAVSKNMCLRILETLMDMGWITQHANGPSYELTLAPYQFFASSRARTTLIDQTLEPLKQLHHEVGESVYLSVLREDKALMIHIIQGTHPISVTGEIGATYDLHVTAPGKVLLAWAEPSFAATFVKRKLQRYTPKTITKPQALKAEMKRVREQGFAINNEEYGAGLLGLAAPVFNENGEVVAAVGIFTPSTNIAPDALTATYAKTVCAAAKAASLS